MKKNPHIQQNIKKMSRQELETFAMNMHAKSEALSQENAWYKEQVKLQQKKLYGTSSEKVALNQISLFDEAEVESTPIADESTITVVKAHSRKKKTRQLDVDALDNRTIDYTLNEAEKSCSCCGNSLHEMSKQVRKELVFIPPKVEVINHVEHIYSCRTCETKGTEAVIVKAKGPRPLIKGSMASASLVANIIVDKYDKAIPLYRQEVSYQRLGIHLNRQNMSNWLLKVSNTYFKAMNAYMHQQLLRMEYISADETVVQVLQEPGKSASSKSYMWAYASGRSERKKMVLYQYEPSRAHRHAVAYLAGYQGILLSDGYQAYDKVEGVVQAGCWAHMRRYFKEALDLVPKGTKKEETQSYVCFTLINELFKIEKKYATATYEELTEIRQKEARPIVDTFFENIHELDRMALPKSHLGKAITYGVQQEKKLRTYLEDGRIELSNNVTERAIRPFTIGRKNWLFMNTVKGANSSGYIYSLVESAKRNGLKPYDYMHYLLTKLPDMDLGKEAELESIMPWAELPNELYQKKS